MMNPMTPFTIRRFVFVALAGVSVLGAAACNTDKLLMVPTPDVVLPGSLQGKESLLGLYASVIGDFQVAYAGGYGAALDNNEGLTQMSGLLSDELMNAETFPTRVEVDKRSTGVNNSSTLQTFQDAQRARALAELVARRFLQYDPTNPQLAEVQSLAGFMYVLLAEDYCNGVPVSTVADDGHFVFGPGQTGQQLLLNAVAKFDSAITLATARGASNVLNLARIGKGRALVDLNRLPEAAAAVAAVPDGYNYSIQHSENSNRENNAIFAFNYLEGRFSVGDQEGENGLPFVSLEDPRLPTFDAGAGFNGFTELFLTSKFDKRDSPTPLAIGSEARLIQAEAAMRANNAVTFLAMLNAARAAAPTYPEAGTGSNQLLASPAPLTAADIPASATGRENLLFEERAVTLFLTSHRVGDLRRLIWQYNRDAESVFPTGAYHQDDSPYGPDVNLPIPKEEENNRNVEYRAKPACMNRSAGIL